MTRPHDQIRGLVDIEAISRWLKSKGVGESVTDVVPLAGGTQNIVVRLRVDGRSLVLRRPPRHPRASNNRILQREIRVLRGLADTNVPCPELVAACEDPDVLDGVVFYVMSDVDGFNPGQTVSPPYVKDPALGHDASLAVAETLAHLGRVDPVAAGLDSMQRSGSFLERQVPQWLALLDQHAEIDGYPSDSLPDVALVAGWLDSNRPSDATPGVMHGDFHLNNVLLRQDQPEVAAIVDWEMCTVGDPLLDLGWILVSWPTDPAPVRTGAILADRSGIATRSEFVNAYADTGGRDITHLDWYTALAAFKFAIVLEGSWARALAGQASRETGEQLHDSAVGLLALAGRIARADWSVRD